MQSYSVAQRIMPVVGPRSTQPADYVVLKYKLRLLIVYFNMQDKALLLT